MRKKKTPEPVIRKTVGVNSMVLKVLGKPEKISITTKVPEKWVIIDTESMHVYGWAPKNERGGGGWKKPDPKVLEAALICLGNSLGGSDRGTYPCERAMTRLGYKKLNRFEDNERNLKPGWHFGRHV